MSLAVVGLVLVGGASSPSTRPQPQLFAPVAWVVSWTSFHFWALAVYQTC